MKRYRVASPHAEEIHTGATFAPGEEFAGPDLTDPEDLRKLEEGRIVEIRERQVPAPSEAVVKKAAELGVDLEEIDRGSGKDGAILVADIERIHKNQEEQK